MQLPKYFSAPEGRELYSLMPKKADEKEPSSEWGVLYRMSGGDPAKLQALAGALEERKKAAEAKYRSPRDNAVKSLEELLVKQQLAGEDTTKTLETLRQLNESKRTPGESPADKDLKRLEDDIMQVRGRLASIKSGQNMMDTAMSSERPEVVNELTNQLEAMNQEYQRRGGNPARLGMSAGGQPKNNVVDQLPNPAGMKPGTLATDTITGKKYRTDGKTWTEIKLNALRN